MSPLLEVDRLSKKFSGRPALAEVSFSVAGGEIVGFVGPNGAGKSTTFRIVCGLLHPDSGTARLDGRDLRREASRFREGLGALIEAPGYWPSLSAFDHLAWLARLRGCYSRALVERTLEEVGLAPDSRKAVGRFSLGMKQRLAIALAILHGPRLLLLDEPMNGLDPQGMASLREFLRGLPAARGVGVLVSSHLLHEVEQICDRVLFIREGRLLTEATLSRQTLQEVEALALRTGDDARACLLLREQGFVREVRELPAGLECRVTAEDVPRVAELLIRSGIPLHELLPRRRSLEQLYLSHYTAAGPQRIE